MSLKDDIVAARDLKERLVTIDSWLVKKVVDGKEVEVPITVLVKELNLGQRLDIFDNPELKTFDGETDMQKATPLIVIASVLDPETKAPVFKLTLPIQKMDKDPDVILIRSKSQGPIREIVNVALDINQLKAGSQDEVKND